MQGTPKKQTIVFPITAGVEYGSPRSGQAREEVGQAVEEDGGDQEEVPGQQKHPRREDRIHLRAAHRIRCVW